MLDSKGAHLRECDVRRVCAAVAVDRQPGGLEGVEHALLQRAHRGALAVVREVEEEHLPCAESAHTTQTRPHGRGSHARERLSCDRNAVVVGQTKHAERHVRRALGASSSDRACVPEQRASTHRGHERRGEAGIVGEHRCVHARERGADSRRREAQAHKVRHGRTLRHARARASTRSAVGGCCDRLRQPHAAHAQRRCSQHREDMGAGARPSDDACLRAQTRVSLQHKYSL